MLKATNHINIWSQFIREYLSSCWKYICPYKCIFWKSWFQSSWFNRELKTYVSQLRVRNAIFLFDKSNGERHDFYKNMLDQGAWIPRGPAARRSKSVTQTMTEAVRLRSREVFCFVPPWLCVKWLRRRGPFDIRGDLWDTTFVSTFGVHSICVLTWLLFLDISRVKKMSKGMTTMQTSQKCISRIDLIFVFGT